MSEWRIANLILTLTFRVGAAPPIRRMPIKPHPILKKVIKSQQLEIKTFVAVGGINNEGKILYIKSTRAFVC